MMSKEIVFRATPTGRPEAGLNGRVLKDSSFTLELSESGDVPGYTYAQLGCVRGWFPQSSLLTIRDAISTYFGVGLAKESSNEELGRLCRIYMERNKSYYDPAKVATWGDPYWKAAIEAFLRQSGDTLIITRTSGEILTINDVASFTKR